MPKADETKARILAAAEKIFSEKGPAGARVDEIAAEANINKRMLYAYFGNKEALYEAVLERVYQRLGQCETFLTTACGEIDVVEAVRQIVPAYFRFLSENESYIRMVMWENLNGARSFDEKGLEDVRDPMRRAIREILQRGIARGVFRRDASEKQLILSLFALTFNYFSNIHTMSRVLKEDLAAQEALHARAEAVTRMILSDLMEISHEQH
jgi:TetR/AcrR family transcriptional regulator